MQWCLVRRGKANRAWAVARSAMLWGVVLRANELSCLQRCPPRRMMSAGSASGEPGLCRSAQRIGSLCILRKGLELTLFSQWATTSSSHLVWDSTYRSQRTGPSELV